MSHGASTSLNRPKFDDPQAINEVRLRHLTVDEALLKLDQYLHDAFTAGLYQVRVIHGKGTGVLREAVAEYARGDSRVKSFRLGASWEGGSGVTVLTLE